MQNDHELDRMIESALTSYSDAEPAIGMETRICARALTGRPPRRTRFWLWMVPVPVFACAIVLVWAALLKPHTRSMPRLQGRIASSGAEELSHSKTPEPRFAQDSHSTTLKHRPSRIQPAPSEQLPKQDTFPSPAPLTAEERQLVALTRSWGSATTAVSGDTSIDIAPLEIAALHIKPVGKSESATDDPAGTTSGSNKEQP